MSNNPSWTPCGERRPRTNAHCELPEGHLKNGIPHSGNDSRGRQFNWKDEEVSPWAGR